MQATFRKLKAVSSFSIRQKSNQNFDFSAKRGGEEAKSWRRGRARREICQISGNSKRGGEKDRPPKKGGGNDIKRKGARRRKAAAKKANRSESLSWQLKGLSRKGKERAWENVRSKMKAAK